MHCLLDMAPVKAKYADDGVKVVKISLEPGLGQLARSCFASQPKFRIRIQG